jgi:CRP/FNR family transcriptional regulator
MKTVACKFCGLKSGATQKLTDDQICTLDNNSAQVHFLAGDIIVKQDALSTNVVYINSGLVKIHVKGPFRERIIKIVKAPAYLCLPSTFGDKINHFSATALAETTVCFIDVNVFKQFIYENGDFAFQIILDLSRGELENFSNCLNNAQKQNIGRIADALLFFSDKIFESTTFTLPISRQEIADLTGITRESASRILTDFHNEKIVEIHNRDITILNGKLLREISEKG